MRESTPRTGQTEFQALRRLTQCVGSDPLLTQASTGNSSIKWDGVLWIKASGKWMADAMCDDFFVPIDWAEVAECLRKGADPAEQFPGASLETAMHSTLPHRVVLHVHCVNTIAWAVRKDAPLHLRRLLDGLRWQWIPYTPSGLPLSRAIDSALAESPDKNVLILGNHGLVLAGEDPEAVEDLLAEVRRRLAICPRQAHPADYAALMELTADSHWTLPDDDHVHALATDVISQAILTKGLLYPCQAVFSDSTTSELFHSIPSQSLWAADRPFLIVEGLGVVVNESITQAEQAMLSGLAQVVQRLSASAPLRYLTEREIAAIPSHVAYRYRELAKLGPVFQ